MTIDPTPHCPFPHDINQRKTGFGHDHLPLDLERQGEVWHVRSYAAVRQLLRDDERVRQGVATDNVLVKRLYPSVIFQDGVSHREQRTAIAKYFTPKTVNESYGALIGTLTGSIIGELMLAGKADLSDLTMQLAVEVGAQVIGLTDSRRPGMARRIDDLLKELSDDAGQLSRLAETTNQTKGLLRMMRFYWMDVRPAIVARRKVPREDVISHLLSKGRSDLEIMVECITYATAGMLTTREFICVAAWHLLEDEALRREYLAGNQATRHRLLHEILRLEPVGVTLLRRAETEIQIEQGGVTQTIPAGARIVLDIRTANADPAAVGAAPLELCPHRALPSGVQPQAMSFGDGPHRCPGAFLAIHESDHFLQRLLSLPIRMTRAPKLTFSPKLMSYEIRDFELEMETSVERFTPSY
ncbi:cytochrome P450 [Deinococcus sp. Arct2-2]|uniref:cytochrome P450 n=1 Tax=Deinococcus sp. Arct2-2 TaxID=2568653 RepID=UPI0010A41077|nr:cytochrome P450 [Deinococcus sp. Arct2-2]THF68885.1 cytochrome P450 [Deinococcus sp. Arct2-2]